MIVSHAHTFTWRGQEAELRVLRNDGWCWGRIIAGGREYDILPDGDLYDTCDTDALELLAELAANHPEMVEPAHGWLVQS